MGLARNSGGEEDGIDRDPRAVCRLPEPDAPAEQSVLGQGRIGLGGGQRSSSSPAAIIAWARR
jgi:hypothetical protein